MKLIRPAVIALCLIAISAPLAAQNSEENKKWHRKSDTARETVYASPDPQKALNDAINGCRTSRPTPNGKPKSGRAKSGETSLQG